MPCAAHEPNEENSRIGAYKRQMDTGIHNQVLTHRERSRHSLWAHFEIYYFSVIRVPVCCSESILGLNKPPFLRPQGPIYQTLDVGSLKASNQETWPFFNAVSAELIPESKSKVLVQFKQFKILGLLPVQAPESAKGELDVCAFGRTLKHFSLCFVHPSIMCS